MAIFSNKSGDAEAKAEAKTQSTAPKAVVAVSISAKMPMILLPRLSEKSSALGVMNKYVFKVATNANKVEIRKAVEKQYGVKVVSVNVVRMQGKARKYGRFSGAMSDFKKAIVTLTPDSKKINTIEPV
jgi:large subunit ribosomal protein L23